MITHAKIVKLQKYTGSPSFDGVMRQIESANEEGLEDYEIEVHKLAEQEKLDLLDAFEAMGYGVTYSIGSELFHVFIGD